MFNTGETLVVWSVGIKNQPKWIQIGKRGDHSAEGIPPGFSAEADMSHKKGGSFNDHVTVGDQLVNMFCSGTLLRFSSILPKQCQKK